MTQQAYIAEGFMEDCEELIQTLTEKFQKVDWHKFCYFWKEMEFDILFYGRQSGPEVVEFTEEILQAARLYMITETHTFETQVIGLFIAYAITLIQPYKNLVSLRLVPSDVTILKKFEAEVRRDGRHDVLMILARMYLLGRTHFHVALRERAMDISIRKYYDGTTNIPLCIGRRWHGILNRQRIQALENIAQEEANYIKLRKQTWVMAKAVKPGIQFQSDMFRPEAFQMAESLRKLTTIFDESKDAKDGETSVSVLKSKAMKIAVDPMKHLHGLDNRQKEKEKPPEPPEPTLKSSKRKKKAVKPTPKPEYKPAIKTYKNDFSKRFSNGGSDKGFSLPSLDDPSLDGPSLDGPSFDGPSLDGPSLNDPSLNDPPTELEDFKLDSIKVPFKGFTKDEIETCDYNKAHPPKSKVINNEAKEKVESKLKSLPDKIKSPANELVKKKPDKDPSPSTKKNGKRKNTPTDRDTTKKKKRLYKNKLNKKLRLNFYEDSDSNTSTELVYTSEDEPLIKTADTKACKGKELTIQTKGVVKHFVEYEINDNIVIRTEKDAPPIEIEYIDNYTGTNAYEEICELSDDEETRKDKDTRKDTEASGSASTSQNNMIECDGDNNDDCIEVFQVITDEGELNINQASSGSYSSVSESRDRADEAVKKILGKTNVNRPLERRMLKRPMLRSKFKKMGLLDFANFDGVDDK